MLYKSLHGQSPHYIRAMVEFHTPERTAYALIKSFNCSRYLASKEKLSQPGPTALWPLCGGTNFEAQLSGPTILTFLKPN